MRLSVIVVATLLVACSPPPPPEPPTADPSTKRSTPQGDVVGFIDQYGAYVINYNLGKDLVASYVERHAGPDPARRWDEFAKLISSPRLPSGLKD